MGTLALIFVAGWLGQTAPALAVQPAPYGTQGTSEISASVGFSFDGDVGVGVGYRRFVLERLAPGLEAAYFHQNGFDQGWLMASLKGVLVQRPPFVLSLIGRGGRLFLSDHDDGWAVGGGPSLQVPIGRNFAIEVGYEIYGLFPGGFCDDFSDCILQRPYVGILLQF